MSGIDRLASLVPRLLLSSFVFALGLVAADQILNLAGFPSENPALFAHPPNFFETRVNLDFKHTFQTNSIGLRNQEVPEAKTFGEVRFLILGDSFVEGYGVEADETFVALLEAARSAHPAPTRFINGGLSGAGPREYARLYYRVGVPLDLDWVMICISPNDLTGTQPGDNIESIYALPERSGLREALYAIFPRIYTRISLSGLFGRRRSEDFIQQVNTRARAIGRSEQEIAEWTAELPVEIVEAVDQGKFNGSILASGLLTPEYWVESLDLEGPRALAKWTAMTMLLDEIVKIAGQNRHRVVLVYIPSRFQYAPPGPNRLLWEQSGTEIRDGWRSEDSELQRRLLDWSEERGLPLLDLTPTFRARIDASPSLVFPRDDHWSPEGHRLAAEVIGAWLDGIGAASAIAAD